MDQKSKTSKILSFAVYAVTFALFFLYFIHFNERTKDDITYYEVVRLYPSILDFVKFRYEAWTSRVIVEFIICCFHYLDLIWFKLAYAAIFTLICFNLARVLGITKIPEIVMINLLVLSFPLFHMSDAGFIAVTINYAVPILCLLVALLPIVRTIRGESSTSLQWFVAIICLVIASSVEISAALLLGLMIYCNILLVLGKKSINLVFCIVPILGIVFTMMCPGNAIRLSQEIPIHMPDYESWTFTDKILQGAYHGLVTALRASDLRYYFFIMVLIIMGAVYKNKIKAALAIASGIILIGLNRMDSIWPELFGDGFGDLFDGSFGDTINLIVLAIGFCVIVASVIFSGEDIKKGLTRGVVFMAGFMSTLIMGFTPTIIGSGWRVFNYFIFAVMFVIASVVKDNEYFKDLRKNPIRIICMAFVLVILGKLLLSNIAFMSNCLYDTI